MTTLTSLPQIFIHINAARDADNYDEMLKSCNQGLSIPLLSKNHQLHLLYLKILAHKGKKDFDSALKELSRGFALLANIEISNDLHQNAIIGLQEYKAHFKTQYFALKANIFIDIDGDLSERALLALYESQLYFPGTHAAFDVKELDCQIRSIFEKEGKEGVFKAIKRLPRPIRLPLLRACIDSNTLLGEYFYEQRGLMACQMDSGVLKQIVNYLDKLKKFGPVKWEDRGDQALIVEDYHSALAAYQEALEIFETLNEQARGDKEARVKLKCGDVCLLQGDYQAATTYYDSAINQLTPASEYYATALILHLNAIVSQPNLSIIEVINYLEMLDASRTQGTIYFTKQQEDNLTLVIDHLFKKYGKHKIFEAITTVDEDVAKRLLGKCLLPDHYFGKHFWVNKVPGTSCDLESGTLKKIQIYLDKLNGCYVKPESFLSRLPLPFFSKKNKQEPVELDVLDAKAVVAWKSAANPGL